jgi:hypothetical protein
MTTTPTTLAILREQQTEQRPLPRVGLEADNLLSILATLGLLRALDESRQDWQARVDWRARVDWQAAPWTARLHLVPLVGEDEVADAAAQGIAAVAARFDVDGRRNVRFTRDDFRRYALRVRGDPVGAALAAALSAECPEVNGEVRAAPLVLFGVGRQNFLDRLVDVPRSRPDAKDAKTTGVELRSPVKIAEALFAPWTRRDASDSFRWDPEEDRRHDTTGPGRRRQGLLLTMHGANRLAALGLLSFSCVPCEERQAAAAWDDPAQGFVWPIWTSPLSLRAIEALLTHPDVLHGRRDRLLPLGVAEVYFAQRFQAGPFMSVARAVPR